VPAGDDHVDVGLVVAERPDADGIPLQDLLGLRRPLLRALRLVLERRPVLGALLAGAGLGAEPGEPAVGPSSEVFLRLQVLVVVTR
jgi:hypothetical protein